MAFPHTGGYTDWQPVMADKLGGPAFSAEDITGSLRQTHLDQAEWDDLKTTDQIISGSAP